MSFLKRMFNITPNLLAEHVKAKIAISVILTLSRGAAPLGQRHYEE
jgi:hypothetical protein